MKRVALTRALAPGRIWLVSGLVVAALLFGGGLALAASATIVGTGGNVYSAATYSTDQGEVSQLQVTGSMHNVTARQTGPDGRALFRSATISGGSTPVAGTQYLPAGDYHFFCTVHPATMNGTLHVTGNGAAQPRPQATLKLTTRKLSKAIKRGVMVALNTSARIDGVSLTVKLGKTTIGSASGLSLGAGRVSETVKLSKAGKKKLSGREKASIKVTADIPFGSPASTKAKLS